MKVGASHGVVQVWREKNDDEKWADDCVGKRQVQESKVMCWGMIMYSYKGPFHVWEAETEKEKLQALVAIKEINAVAKEKAE